MKDYSYLIGTKLHNREVIGISNKPYYVTCICKCGEISDVAVSNIQKSKWGSCKSCIGESKMNNLVGKRSGRLLILQQYYKKVNNLKQCRLICICDCGKTVDISRDSYKSTKSCGCSRIIFKDRERHQGIFISWKCMMQRCYNPKQENYKYYGAEGVFVDERWRIFINFYMDLREMWFKGATIDRFPLCNGNYVLGNVRWATTEQQNRNKTTTIFTEQDILDIRQSTLSRSELIKKYNSTSGSISRIINHKRWTNL